MSQPLEDSEDELEVAREAATVGDFDGELTKALRRSKMEARWRHRQQLQAHVNPAAAAGRVLDPEPVQPQRKRKHARARTSEHRQL